MDNGIPIFPAGVVKIYQNPNPPIIPNVDNLNYVRQTDGNPDTTQFGSCLLYTSPSPRDGT